MVDNQNSITQLYMYVAETIAMVGNQKQHQSILHVAETIAMVGFPKQH